MVGKLLLGGMLVGVLAGLFAFAFLKVAGEPQVERAIAFESRMDAMAAEARAAEPNAAEPNAAGMAMPATEAGVEVVSRPTQAGIGLLTGVVVYSVAFGGLFALVFAVAYGRMAALGPRATSALLAALGFIAVYVVPNLKYPANPPSVGDAATIGTRTALYFAMVALSLAVMVGAGLLRRRLLVRQTGWDAALLAGAAYLAVVVAAAWLMPDVNEVPEQFPATVLWQFRVASFGAQAIMWSTLGLGFGLLVERTSRRERWAGFQAAAI